MRRRNGQSLAEFALILPVLFLVIFGLLDLGRAVYVYNTVANAARQGARVASVNQSTTNGGQCDPQDRSRWSIVACIKVEGISLALTNSNITDICYYDSASYSSCSGTETFGDACNQREVSSTCIARVTVVYPYTPFTPIVGDLIGNITLSSTSEMPVEAWYTPQ